MSKLLIAVFGAMLIGSVGCHHDRDDNGMRSEKSEAKMMSNDACPHCPGIQKATADGKCPVCGADVSKK